MTEIKFEEKSIFYHSISWNIIFFSFKLIFVIILIHIDLVLLDEVHRSEMVCREYNFGQIPQLNSGGAMIFDEGGLISPKTVQVEKIIMFRE
jgi:hypothetical protein